MDASRILNAIHGANSLAQRKMIKVQKIAVCVAILLLWGCLAPPPVYAKTIRNIPSVSRPEDSIRLTYKVDNSTGILILAVNGTPNDVNVRIAKDGKEYLHHISSEMTTEIPLSLGNGEYQLDLRLYVTPTIIEPIWGTSFPLQMENTLAPWLSTSRIVNWTPEMELADKARSLVVPNNQQATGLALCQYISERYTYDNSITVLPPTYLPDLELVYRADTGICYDFAALYTAMSRSVGIPCRLVMGYSAYMGENKYHAWCQIYVDGQWLTVDPTYSLENGVAFLDDTQMTAQYFY